MIKLSCQRQNEYLEVTLHLDSPFRDDSQLQPKSGKVSYRNFIEELSVSCNERLLFNAQFNPAMAAHPELVFRAKHILNKDVLKVQWQDNAGKSALESFTVTV